MIGEIKTIEDIQYLSEAVDFECKQAKGADGQGELPGDFWKTYSAMANTKGGVIALGIKENTRGFELVGIPNINRIKKQLFDILNNPNKVSVNLLTDKDVQVKTLEARNFLEQTGTGRGAVYHLIGNIIPGPEDVFGSDASSQSSMDNSQSSMDNSQSSMDCEPGTDTGNSEKDTLGRLLDSRYDLPFIEDLDQVTQTFKETLTKIAQAPQDKKRVSSDQMQEIIEKLVDGHYMTLSCLSQLVCKTPSALRTQYLKPMIQNHQIKIAFPKTPNDPRQAYTRGNS